MEPQVFQHKGIIVIDDDMDFGALITHLGKERNLPITHFPSLKDLGSVALLGEYDVAVLDYFLDEMNGVEVAEYLDAFFPWIPAVLTSGETYIVVDKNNGMPACVERFVSKSCGVDSILNAAINAIKRKKRLAI